MALLLLMLCSGLFQIAASNHLRLFVKSAADQSTRQACRECRETNGSILSLYDEKDANFTKWMLENETQDQSFWLGLHKNPDKVATWSNGDNFTTHLLEQEIDQNRVCGAIANHEWKLFNCSESKYFMCRNASGYVLIEEQKNWCQAQWYCRRYYRDLISIGGAIPHEVKEKGGKATFWTGLLLDSWHWEDGQCSTYRDWKMTNENEQCAAMTQSGMKTYGCSNVARVICSKGYHRVKIIQEMKTWEEARDYCNKKHAGMLWIEDDEDQKAVEDELNFSDYMSLTKTKGPFWIAMRQSSAFGFWIWSDRIVSYSKWIHDLMPEMPLSHKCGVIDPGQEFNWSDADCSRKLPFLCEEEIHS